MKSSEKNYSKEQIHPWMTGSYNGSQFAISSRLVNIRTLKNNVFEQELKSLSHVLHSFMYYKFPNSLSCTNVSLKKCLRYGLKVCAFNSLFNFTGLPIAASSSEWRGEVHTVVTRVLTWLRAMSRYFILLTHILLSSCTGAVWQRGWPSKAHKSGKY